MILPDVNLLVYSIDESNQYHHQTRTWWDNLLSSKEKVILTYPAILGFIRITTHARIFENPLTISEAIDRVDGWLEQPNVHLLSPTSRHWNLLKDVMREVGIGANLTTDAHLAALAIEHGCVLYSNDRDFDRFEGLRWHNPLQS